MIRRLATITIKVKSEPDEGEYEFQKRVDGFLNYSSINDAFCEADLATDGFSAEITGTEPYEPSEDPDKGEDSLNMTECASCAAQAGETHTDKCRLFDEGQPYLNECPYIWDFDGQCAHCGKDHNKTRQPGTKA